jgi:N-acetylneuraminate synthase
MSCFIIAEIGVNHNGDTQIAKNLILAAKKAGADAVKFQTFRASELVTKTAAKAQYQKETTSANESQLAMLEKLELSHQQHVELYDFCQQQQVTFLSTPFDFPSVKFLTQELGLKRLKISSGDLTNAPMLLACAQTGCQIIISTGMATMTDIEQALGVLAFGYLSPKLKSDIKAQDFVKAYHSKEGQALLKKNICILHCTTDYPAQFSDINLNVLDSYQAQFNLPVGYSDHSLGTLVSVTAVAKGASIIEKHITLDKTMSGPDHRASIEPDEFALLVSSIRDVETILGHAEKAPTLAEQKNMPIARKSLVASMDIKQGEHFSENNVAIKRPGSGRSPIDYWRVLNQKAHKDYQVGDLLE